MLAEAAVLLLAAGWLATTWSAGWCAEDIFLRVHRWLHVIPTSPDAGARWSPARGVLFNLLDEPYRLRVAISALHVGSGALTAAWARRLGASPPVAIGAMLLFFTYPAGAEAIYWIIAGVSYVPATFLILLVGVLCAEEAPRRWQVVLAALAALAAPMFHEQGALVVVAAAVSYRFGARAARATTIAAAVCGTLSATVVAIAKLVLADVVGLSEMSWTDRGRLFCELHLNAHAIFDATQGGIGVWFEHPAGPFIVAVLIAAVHLAVALRTDRIALAAYIVFIGLILPPALFAGADERFYYAASPFIAVFTAAVVASVCAALPARWARAPILAGALIVVTLGALELERRRAEWVETADTYARALYLVEHHSRAVIRPIRDRPPRVAVYDLPDTLPGGEAYLFRSGFPQSLYWVFHDDAVPNPPELRLFCAPSRERQRRGLGACPSESVPPEPWPADLCFTWSSEARAVVRITCPRSAPP